MDNYGAVEANQAAIDMRTMQFDGAVLRGHPTVEANRISRKRIIELQKLAIEAVAWGEAHGLKRGEQCMFREMCERLWWAD